MNQSELFQARWRWPHLVICNLVALGILASWLWQPTRQLWDHLDINVFRSLNNPLSTNAVWAHVWAIGNMRYADIGMALITLGALAKGGLIFDNTRVRGAFYGFLALLLLLFLIRIGPVREVMMILDWHRASPSLLVDGAVRITKMFPGWKDSWYMKDSSNHCFPGDHAAVVLLWLLFIWPFASPGKRTLAAVLSTVFVLPRLVSGAHWLSDDLVGGLSLTLVAIGYGLYTPYAVRVLPLLERLVDPVLRLLGRIPALNRIHLISGR